MAAENIHTPGRYMELDGEDGAMLRVPFSSVCYITVRYKDYEDEDDTSSDVVGISFHMNNGDVLVDDSKHATWHELAYLCFINPGDEKYLKLYADYSTDMWTDLIRRFNYLKMEYLD